MLAIFEFMGWVHPGKCYKNESLIAIPFGRAKIADLKYLRGQSVFLSFPKRRH
jgi:hypothetical protein